MFKKPHHSFLFSFHKTSLAVGMLLGVSIVGAFFYAFPSTVDKPTTNSPIIEPFKTAVCFTPPRGCTDFIVNAIKKAKNSIFIQAYSLTCKDITATLIKAHQQGIKVIALVDKGQIKAHHSQIHNLIDNNIPVYIDSVPGLAHNKIVIIDAKTIVTGSFNYSTNADTRNAENVLLIENSKVANLYLANWQKRLDVAHPLYLKKKRSVS
jgi:phospholipase D